MAVRFNNQDVKYNLKEKRRIANWIKKVANSHNRVVGEVSIIFVSDTYILSVNNQYLNHNYFTDIITFDYSHKNIIEGDIFISIDTVKSNSIAFNTSYSIEMLRVIIHGVLHLIGFKDKKPLEKKEMSMNEDLALSLLFNGDDK